MEFRLAEIRNETCTKLSARQEFIAQNKCFRRLPPSGQFCTLKLLIFLVFLVGECMHGIHRGGRALASFKGPLHEGTFHQSNSYPLPAAPQPTTRFDSLFTRRSVHQSLRSNLCSGLKSCRRYTEADLGI
jgi:hypothetical protein